MNVWARLEHDLAARPRRWLVTGAAGFIGSHLVETLLGLGQEVRGLDDFSTGSQANLDEVRRAVGERAWARFAFERGSILEPQVCARAAAGAEIVLHQAGLGSVPRSIAAPLATLEANVTGFLEVALAARAAGAARLVFASSSSVYGADPTLPRREERLGPPLSPYAASKRIDELLAHALAAGHGLASVALRYFNVFGPRQDPGGPYAAVIPRWIRSLLAGEPPRVHGDGESSRDFCPVAVAVQANLLAASAPLPEGFTACNVALGRRTTLNELARRLTQVLAAKSPGGLFGGGGGGGGGAWPAAVHDEARPGDVRHSQAELSRAREWLGLEPCADLEQGLARTVDWFLAKQAEGASLRPSQSAR